MGFRKGPGLDSAWPQQLPNECLPHSNFEALWGAPIALLTTQEFDGSKGPGAVLLAVNPPLRAHFPWGLVGWRWGQDVGV